MSHWEALQKQLNQAFEQGVTMEEAERWAAKCLSAQIDLSQELMTADLGARMRKNEYKTMRARVYLDTVQASEGKKPTEAMIEAIIATSQEVAATQNAFEEEENASEALQRLYDIFRDGHLFYRGVAKGTFGG